MENRNRKGEYSTGWMKRIGYTFLFVFIAWMAMKTALEAAYVIGLTASDLHYIAAPRAEAAEIVAADKIEQMKGDVLDRLAKCESGGKSEIEGITTLDTNGVGSYGPYQFQRKTVMYYYEKMTGEKISGRDAIILALQGDKARELAKYVIFDTDAGVASDWVICSRNNNLQPMVDFIKAHE